MLAAKCSLAFVIYAGKLGGIVPKFSSDPMHANA